MNIRGAGGGVEYESGSDEAPVIVSGLVDR